MTTWRIETLEKKNIEVLETWVKLDEDENEISIIKRTGYRFGAYIFNTPTDDMPTVDLANPDGINLMEQFDDIELDYVGDEHFSNWEFVDEDDEEIVDLEEISDGYDDNGTEFMEENGWEQSNTQIWFYGPIEITKVED